jgi:hypothetical protein
MSEVERYVKAGEPDRLVSTVASKVHAEFDGFKPADQEREAKPEEESTSRRGRKASE